MLTNWSKDGALVLEFELKCLDYLAKSGWVDLEDDEDFQIAEVREYIGRFVGATAALDIYQNGNFAYAEFVKWAELNLMHKPRRVSDVVAVQVSITRVIGNQSFTFGLTADYEISGQASYRAAFDELRGMIAKQFINLSPADAAPAPAPAPAPTQQPLPAAETPLHETVLCEYVTEEIQAGVRKVRAHGGRWVKYGVPVYPEVLIESPFADMKSFPGGRLNVGNYKMTLTLNASGKPGKVTKFERVV